MKLLTRGLTRFCSGVILLSGFCLGLLYTGVILLSGFRLGLLSSGIILTSGFRLGLLSSGIILLSGFRLGRQRAAAGVGPERSCKVRLLRKEKI